MNNTYVSIIVTKRCNARCQMCDCWENPSNAKEEISLETLKKLPHFKNITITGGEPFIRNDIEDIIDILQHKADRILINTNGYFTDKIVRLGKRFPKVGIRISIDGLQENHNKIRGIDIYEHAMDSLKKLEQVRGKKDLGIGFTLQDDNYQDMLPLYRWAHKQGYEFGMSVVHNSAYFNKSDNEIKKIYVLEKEIDKLSKELLKSKKPKDWVRAYFVEAEKTNLRNLPKPLMCEAGRTSFFIDSHSNVLPCNGMPKDLIMGNLNEMDWDEIIHSEKAKKIEECCRNCKLNCWMICNLGSAIRNHLNKPAVWVFRKKFLKKSIYKK